MRRRLTAEQRLYVIQRLACFESPTAVKNGLEQIFGVEVSRQLVESHDPTKVSGKKLAKPLRETFRQVRARFLRDLTDVPIAHRAYRLRELQRLFERDFDRGATAFAAQHLEQAAKEMGEIFTNRRVLTSGDPVDELARALGVGKDDMLRAVGLAELTAGEVVML